MPLRDIKTSVNIFWFRRDLRFADNIGLFHALNANRPVLALFIFDTEILDELPADDPRVTFIHYNVRLLNLFLHISGSSILAKHGKPIDIFEEITEKYTIENVFCNEDYEPYARQRDSKISAFLNEKNIGFKTFKDQVVFAPGEILKADGKPYTVYTPYAKKWREKFAQTTIDLKPVESLLGNFVPTKPELIYELPDIGFTENRMPVPDPVLNKNTLSNYAEGRDFPALDNTSALSVHFRFGKISIRKIAKQAAEFSSVFLGELIWREFFMQILYFYPDVVTRSFKPAYDRIEWRNNPEEFEAWCEGRTGYPMVDAGMRQLKQTGNMHNRVRMVAASFLTKHLLTDWRKGEAYFSEKLMDYDLSANNGNWQWASGSGCDAAPYFRIFNPTTQAQKFDKDEKYIRKWIPEYGTEAYPKPIVEHAFARQRALDAYKTGLA